MESGVNSTARQLLVTGAVFGTLFTCGCGEPKQEQLPGESTGSSIGKLVTFEAPKYWILQNHLTQGNSESFQFLIPDAATDGTTESANAGISIEPVRDRMNVTNFANFRLQTKSSPYGYAVLTNIFAGDKWCSAVTRGQQNGTPYVIMDRFGVDQGVMVFFRVAHPVLTNNASAVTLSISNFNAVVRSLKIRGMNSVNSEMRQDHGVIWLRSFGDMDTNWMVSATNSSIYRSPLPRE